MIRSFIALAALIVLVSCGADGPPTPPTVSGNTSVSMNSNRGVSTSATVGIHFGSN